MPVLWMLGHSDRRFPVLADLLQSQDIAHLVDIRAYPASRRHPQFDRLELEKRLPLRGMRYTWMPQLGGMRAPVAGSNLNAAWKEDGLRAYADHMQTAEFAAAWEELAQLAQRQRTAAMCAEAKPLSCHRQILADAFVARQWTVQHIVDATNRCEHTLSPAAFVNDRLQVSYPGAPQLPF